MALDGGEVLELLCPICYGEQNESGYSTLICGHVFHASCLEKSLRLKKECPSCRCPAKPVEHVRREGGTQPRCPCKTGQPVRLYHLQRPRNGADGLSQPSGTGAGGAAAASGLDAAAAAAAAQRETRLREALQDERKRVSELELEVTRQEAEVTKALEKAERRKQRLAALEKDHQATTTRLLEDKSRLEGRERDQSEELSRMRQALHNTRMDLEKTRASLYEREEAVMRLKREVAMQRARAGGAAALQPREMAELLGERKEDWQAVYSMKVEELRRAMDTAAELRTALAKSATDADARVAAERLAGAERVKAVAQERDDVKRELIDLEYKLHETEHRLRELQELQQQHPATGGAVGRPPAGPSASVLPQRSLKPPHAGASSCAAPSATRTQQQQHQQLRQMPSAPRHTAIPPGHPKGQPVKQPVSLQQQRQQQQRAGPSAPSQAAADEEEEEDDLEALALMALSCPVSEDLGEEEGEEEPSGGDGGTGRELGQRDIERVLSSTLATASTSSAAKRNRGPGSGAVLTAAVPEHPGTGGSVGGGASDAAAGDDDDDDGWEYDATPYNLPGAEGPPANKRQRQGQTGGGVTGAGGGDGGEVYGIGGAGSPNLDVDGGDDTEPVPVLPRAFSGLFAGGRAQPAAGRGPAAGPGGGGSALGAAHYGPSFASKAGLMAAGGGRSGSASLIGEGPDGRGGTARFPLTSSFAHNALKTSMGGGKGLSSGRAGGGGRGSGPGKQNSVVAAGRIEAFLRPVGQQPNRR